MGIGGLPPKKLWQPVSDETCIVAWTRTLTGEKGYVGSFSTKRFWPVVAVEHAQRMTPEKANEVARRLNEFVGTYAYTIEVSP